MKSSTLNHAVFNLLNMDHDFTTLSGRIRWRMQECKFKSAAALARAASVSRGTSSLWLNGTTHEIEGPNLTKLAKILKCNAHWLQTGEGNWYSGIEGIQIPEPKMGKNVVQYPCEETKLYGYAENKLLHYFAGLSDEHKQDLIAQAEAWFLRDNPNALPIAPDPAEVVKKRKRKM